MAEQGKSWTENVFPDRYARNARLYPSLLVIAPTVIAIVAIAGLELSWLKMLWLGLGAVGGTYWLSQLARDPGKVLENKLWESWGGMPSVAILRHGDRRIDAITKARYYARLVELVRTLHRRPPTLRETVLMQPISVMPRGQCTCATARAIRNAFLSFLASWLAMGTAATCWGSGPTA